MPEMKREEDQIFIFINKVNGEVFAHIKYKDMYVSIVLGRFQINKKVDEKSTLL